MKMYITKRLSGILKMVLWALFGLSILALAISVVKSALGYQFDNDELYHVQQVYLSLSQGLKPYTGFYSVYSPFLMWLLTPIFALAGFSLQTITYARVCMVVLFAIRTGLAYLFVKKLFNRFTALFFVLFTLLDPFTVFVAMQIRPENVMMVVYQILLLALLTAFTTKSKRNFFITGVLAGLTLLVSLKIIPSLLVLGVVTTYFLTKKKHYDSLIFFINGFVLSFFVFFLYYFVSGGLFEMFQQLFIDPFLLNNAIKYPTTLNYFYFANPVIYGFEGKPAAWFFAVLLPATAFAGAYGSISELFDKKINGLHEVKIVLFLSFVVQWVSMMFIHSVWIQYYIPLLWFYALFTAVLLDITLTRLNSDRLVKSAYILVVVVLLAILIKSSIVGNGNRSRISSDGWHARLDPIWARIPENADVFPNMLFRKAIYPIPYGGTYSTYIMNRYEPIESVLNKKQVPYVVLEGDMYESLLPNSQQYINDYYAKDPQLPVLYTRIKKK